MSLPQIRQSELMDHPRLSPSLHLAALNDLDHLNRLSFTADQLWREIRRHSPSARKLSVLDIAGGSRNVAARVCELGRRAGYDVCVDLCDISPFAVDLARSRHAGNIRSAFQLDVLAVRA